MFLERVQSKARRAPPPSQACRRRQTDGVRIQRRTNEWTWMDEGVLDEWSHTTTELTKRPKRKRKGEGAGRWRMVDNKCWRGDREAYCQLDGIECVTGGGVRSNENWPRLTCCPMPRPSSFLPSLLRFSFSALSIPVVSFILKPSLPLVVGCSSFVVRGGGEQYEHLWASLPLTAIRHHPFIPTILVHPRIHFSVHP